MPAPFALLIIVVASLATGGLILGPGGWRRLTDPLERLFASLALGLLSSGWLALLLAEAGVFSLARLAALWGIAVVLLAWRWRRAHNDAPSDGCGRVSRAEVAALMVWLATALWLFFRPHESILGGADAGVYVSAGANLSRTGALLIFDPALALLEPADYPAWLRPIPPREAAAPYYLLPGFYVPGDPPGRVIPQFYPLHMVWLAIGHALGGLPTELLITPLWACLGCLAFYVTIRALWGWPIGFLALAALSLNALQVWFARYPTAEMLTQALLWTGMWAFVAWITGRGPRAAWAAIAGLALGQVMLTRIDFYFLLAIPVGMGVWLVWTRSGQRDDLWFFIPFALLAVHSLAHGLLWSRPYFLSLMRYGGALATRQLMIPSIAAAAASIVLILLSLRGDRRGRLPARLRTWRPFWAWLSAALVIALAVYGYWVRPQVEQTALYSYWYGGGQIPKLDHENLVRLGWYLTPLGLALGVGGVCWMLMREANRRTALILAIGLFASLFYLWRIQINPHQIYAMRRYAPAVAPFLMLAAAVLIGRLAGVSETPAGSSARAQAPWHLWRLGLAGGLTLAWMFGIVDAARGFIGQVDDRGLIAQIEQFNARLAPRSLLIFNDPAPVGAGDFLGTPLRFLYEREVFTLRDPQAIDRERLLATVHRWQAAGWAVYWAATPGGEEWPGEAARDLQRVDEWQLSSRALEGAYDHKPQAIIVREWSLTLWRVQEEAP
jgi:hypothetical protein